MLLAAFFLSLCSFHYPAGSAMPQMTSYNQKITCARPRLDQLYSEVLQGLLHFFQQQRGLTLVTLRDFLGHSQSESVDFLVLPLYHFWLLQNPVQFCICSAACIKCCTHSSSTSPSVILMRGGNSVAYHVTFYF